MSEFWEQTMRISFLVLMIFVSSIAFAEQSKQEKKREVCESMKSATQALIDVGLVRKWNKSWNEVFIDNGWYGLEFQQKENLIKVIAECYSNGGVATFKNAYSGKVIAEVGPWVGYKIYE